MSALAVALAVACAAGPEGDAWDPVGSTSAAVEEPIADTGSESEGADLPPTPEDPEASSSGDTGDPDAAAPSLGDAPRVRVEAGEIDDAELVETLPVGTSENGAKRRVALRLAPSELPDLLAGDRLVAAAEVQVTTRCDVGQSAPGCNYDPKIRAQLILTGDPDDDDPDGPESRALSSMQTQTCTKSEHHCMFMFRPSDATRTIEAGLPCVADGNCRVNLVMWAWDGRARSGGEDKVIVGGNEGNYLDNQDVDPDKARLMVVRERDIDDGDRHHRESTRQGGKNVPTTAAPVLVYSHALATGDLREGEQFVVEAKIVASVGGRARFSSEMFVTKDANATDGGGLDAIAPRQIGEHNGINCVPSRDCTTRKVAVFRVTDDIAGPVYVNVVVKSEVPGGGSTSVTVHRGDGWLRSTRYEADHAG